MEKFPLVSIIVPVYNGEQYIAFCIESLLAQSYPNKEIIIVDDGSSDSTAEIVKSYGSDVRYFSQANAGSAVARNTGIENAQGDYIAFNDGDDLWAPRRLEQQVKFLEEHSEYGVAAGRFTHVGTSFSLDDCTPVPSTDAKIDQEKSGWVYHRLFECSWYHIIAALVRKDLLKTIRFTPDFRRGQDYDFWLQLANATKIAQLTDNYAYYRKNEDSISHKPHLRNYRAEIMEHALATMGNKSQSGEKVSEQELNNRFYQVWFEYGYELFLAGWYKLALTAFKKARTYSPYRLGSYKFILKSFALLKADKSPS